MHAGTAKIEISGAEGFRCAGLTILAHDDFDQPTVEETEAHVVSAVAGGIIGSAIGKALDDEECWQLALAIQRAAAQPVVNAKPANTV